MFTFDIVIVGAGIAGLYCGIQLAKKGKSVCILEKYNYIGGRVVTYHKGELSWENGAGRISDSHTMVHSLLSQYGLKTFPLSDKQLFIESDGTAHVNRFENVFEAILKEISDLPYQLLATHTLEQLLKRVYGEAKAMRLLTGFAYRAEVSVLRADLAIKAFSKDGEMGSYKGYSVVIGGLSKLIDAMVKEFKKNGGILKTECEMIGLSQGASQALIKCRDTVFNANKVILALHSSALKACPDTRHFPALKHLVMCPLMRTYAVFPLKDGKPWFAGLERCVSAGPIRYFIPINEKKGIAMVSYTDADNADYLIKMMDNKGEEALGKYIIEELGKMFPDRDIPPYTLFKAHPWYSGCSYWTAGSYDPVIMSEEAMHPDTSMPSVYVCGESFSLKQAWMEGALEHASDMLNKYFN